MLRKLAFIQKNRKSKYKSNSDIIISILLTKYL